MTGGTDDTTIETRTGPVRGEHKRGAFRCKGIPFAAPPVGGLRFRPPQPPVPWTGAHDGTGRFPIAPQPMAGMEAAAGGAGGAEQSEAGCLTLNVWTPAADDAERPVLFWIHGGGFLTGAGTTPWYEGSALARRDVVVVTTNYRLGALGFLELGSLDADLADSGNVGLLDQIAALEWVRDNIEAFGGDPGNVTIAGESAGGMSVATLMGTPAAQGLFHKAVPQSGAASHVTDLAGAGENAEKLLALLGVDTIEALRALPAEDLIEAQGKVGSEFGRAGGLPFQPVVGGSVLPRQPLDAVRDALSADIPLLTGTNRHEMRLFTALDPRVVPDDRARVEHLVDRRSGGNGAAILAAYEAAGESTSRGLYEAAATDMVFRMPAIDLLEAHAAHAPSYGYEFHFESTAFDGALGAGHAVEIPFMFDNLDRGGVEFFTGPATDDMHTLATTMADAWAAFAHTGVPAADGLPDWPAYTPDDRQTMILDVEPRVASDPAADVRSLWRPSS
ncbi:MAG: carboxylesterase/lipase family protein [Acidimicrobiales bacterium]|nr:carboxylesterase/lipase family protein [Acidimicrobiales bacterium]